MTGKLEGKVAFITGAARGQGRSHAVRLAEEGADIIAVDVLEQIVDTPYPPATEEDLAETARQVEALDRRIVTAKADVRDLASLTSAVDDGVAQLGRLDIVAANAGVLTGMTPTSSMDDDLWDDMVDINLSGVWRSVKAAVPHIRAGGRGGAIVFTSSIFGLRGTGTSGHYVAAKHGIVGLMRSLAIELGPEMIRVNTIHPTQVDTDMIQNDRMYRAFSPEKDAPTREDFAPKSQAMHLLPVPWVEPRDISNALLFLVSDDARYITGVSLPVDLGMLAK
jgi:(+)-trans-carveol dehydrogenase